MSFYQSLPRGVEQFERKVRSYSPNAGGALTTNKKRLLGRPALIDPTLMALVAKRDFSLAQAICTTGALPDAQSRQLSNGASSPT